MLDELSGSQQEDGAPDQQKGEHSVLHSTCLGGTPCALGHCMADILSRLGRLSMVTPVLISSVVLEDALGWAKLVGWYTRYCTCFWARSDYVAEKGSQSPFQGVQAFKLQLRNPLLQNRAQPLRATAQYTSWPAIFVQQVDHPHGALLPSIEPRCWCAMCQVAASSNDPL